MSNRLLQLTIPARSGACHGCEERFSEGDPVFSTLIEEGRREDRCAKCWDTYKAPDTLLSLWQGVVPSKKVEKAKEMEAQGRDRALALLREYLEAKKLGQAFLLALYLERRGVLVRCKELRRKVGRVRLYEVCETGEALYVPRREEQKPSMQEEILQALRGDG